METAGSLVAQLQAKVDELKLLGISLLEIRDDLNQLIDATPTAKESKQWALHGYGQNGAQISNALDKLKLEGKKKHAFACFTGPWVPDFAATGTDAANARGWWFLDYKALKEEVPARAPNPTFDQMIDCLTYGVILVEKFGQPETVLGFSQGATCLALWIRYGIIKPRRAVFVATFCPSALIDDAILEVSSLHLFGQKDTLVQSLIPWEQEPAHALSLVRNFKDAQVARFSNGHVVPCNAESRKMIEAFLLNTK